MAGRKVVSRSISVDPNLVGKKYSTGGTHSLGIKDAEWDCNSCGHKNIVGNVKICPSCGNPKDSSENYREPSIERPYLSPAELDARGVDKDHGSDEECPSCGSKVPPKTQICPQCGSSIKNVGKTTLVCPNCSRETMMSLCQSCGTATVPKTLQARREPSITTYSPSFPSTVEPGTNGMPKWLLAMIGLGAIGIISLCIFGAINYFTPKVNVGSVSASSWSCEVPVIENQYVLTGSWNGVPAGGDYVREYEKFHHNDKVFDHTDPGCKDYWEVVGNHQGPGTPKDVCVDNYVYDYTEHIVYDDGTKEDIVHTKNDPICHEEPTTITIDDYDWVEHCNPFPVYRDVPVNQTWYEYNIWQWVSLKPLSASGNDSVISCPAVHETNKYKQNGNPTIVCATSFSINEDQYPYSPDCSNEFPRYFVGSQWQVTTSGPSITKIEVVP